MGPAQQPIRMDVLTQLTNLTSLWIYMDLDMKDNNDSHTREVDASSILNLPGLRSLHMTSFRARDLLLLCPKLRKLTMDYPWIK